MKYKVTYCNLDNSHLFAKPTPTYIEIVESDTFNKLSDYICTKTDDWGNYFKLNDDAPDHPKPPEFLFISKYGGVKVEEYIEPTIIKI